MTIAISGQVPAEAQNGMYKLESLWTQEATPDAVFAIVRIERDGLKFKDSDQVWSSTMKFSAIEPILDADDLATVRKLQEKACGARGGDVQPTLDGTDAFDDAAPSVVE